MKFSKKACFSFFMLANLYVFGFESNESLEKISSETIVFEDDVPFVRDEWGALFFYPEIRFTHQGVYLERPREKNVLYICANNNCGKVYQNQKPVRCGNCRGNKFIIRYQ